MILIGSGAVAAYFGGEVKEYDIIATEAEREQFPEGPAKIDWCSPDLLNNAEIAPRFWSPVTVTINGVDVHVCNLRGLAQIYRSHLWRPRKFDKNIALYHKKLKPYFWDEDMTFYNERVRLTKLDHDRGNPNLAQPNEDFFDDAVTKKYDHDWVHEVVAFGTEPLYTKMKRDFSKAWCERDMWDAFEHADKVRCVAEETYVIAIERFMVPNEWKFAGKRAYFRALEKVCTTLTSGWFRDFAIDNYPEIVDTYDDKKMKQAERIISHV